MALLFQSNPDQWDLRHYLEPGKRVSWFVTRYLSYMKPGTLTLLWEAQGTKNVPVKGLYGWGIIEADPASDVRGRIRVPLMFIERWVSAYDVRNKIANPNHRAAILAEEVFKLESWRDHLLARMPIGTNFLVTANQVEELSRIVMKKYTTSMFKQAADLDKAGQTLAIAKFKANVIQEVSDG